MVKCDADLPMAVSRYTPPCVASVVAAMAVVLDASLRGVAARYYRCERGGVCVGNLAGVST